MLRRIQLYPLFVMLNASDASCYLRERPLVPLRKLARNLSGELFRELSIRIFRGTVGFLPRSFRQYFRSSANIAETINTRPETSCQSLDYRSARSVAAFPDFPPFSRVPRAISGDRFVYERKIWQLFPTWTDVRQAFRS